MVDTKPKRIKKEIEIIKGNCCLGKDVGRKGAERRRTSNIGLSK
jgi:hypothetical protein